MNFTVIEIKKVSSRKFLLVTTKTSSEKMTRRKQTNKERYFRWNNEDDKD